jgi:hypothetical protein
MDEHEYIFCHLVGYPDKGGLQRLIDYQIKDGYEIVEGSRTPPEGKSDGTVMMRKRVATGFTTEQSKLDIS